MVAQRLITPLLTVAHNCLLGQQPITTEDKAAAVVLHRQENSLEVLFGHLNQHAPGSIYRFHLHTEDGVSKIKGARLRSSRNGIPVITIQLRERTGWVYADFPLVEGRQTYFTYTDRSLIPETENY